MKRAVLLAVLAGTACGRDAKPPPPPASAALPGTIYVVEDPVLVRYTRGARTEIGQGLFASAQALPDGRVVAISSRGDGSADSEQLALIAANGSVQRIGPTAVQVRDPSVDGRGRWIVVAANLDGHSDLYRVELDGREAQRLTSDVQGNFHPAVVGDSIIYVSSRDGNSELYKGSQRLTNFHKDDWYPTPSPRGDTIAFLSDREGPPRIFLMSPDGTSLRRLTATTDAIEESSPVWSRDGRYLAFVAGGQVQLHDTTTGKARTLTAPGTTELEPAFSPDGAWLAVARTRGSASDVWAIPLAGGAAVEVAKNARLPRWF